jgi:hypothetical protein
MTREAFKANVTDQRTRLTLQFLENPLAMNAGELQQLIDQLAAIREQMLPIVPADPPTKITLQMNPRYEVKGAGPLGGVLIQLRHPGLGWVHAHLPQEQVDRLVEGLQKSKTQTPMPPQKH